VFSNFIYFIIVLLIYTTYPISEDTNFTLYETVLFFFCLIIIFVSSTRIQFGRLEKRISKQDFYRLDHQFNTILTRQFIMASVLFALDVYALSLPSFCAGFPLFSAIPTLQALMFLLLFACHLAMVWAFAHRSYQKLYDISISRRSYVLSNISFSVPVLLPWVFLSAITDIINVLPFDAPKRFLSTTEGEILYFLFFLFAVAVLGPVLIQKFWQCRPLDSGYERSRIEALCRKADMAYRDILRWPIFGGKMITAGVMGLVKNFRYILVTDALLTLLGPEEVDAVIAHEIGHIKKKHLLFYLFFFIGYMLVSYAVFDLIIYCVIYTESLYGFIPQTGINRSTVTSALFSLITLLIFLIYFRYIFGYFMRNFERQADAYVYTLFDSAMPLISTFEKIILTSGQDPDKPNWHHFSIAERIGYLRKCESDKQWITRQDRKIRISIAVYFAGIVLTGIIGYVVNFGETGRKLNTHFFEKIIQQEITQHPENAELYTLLGDVCYSSKNYKSAIAAYKKSLSLKPDNPQVLNNLAWLYATCELEIFRDPESALTLAMKAAELMEAAYILDTLAESYYVNGRFEEAVAAGERALGMAQKDHFHYEAQLKKFNEALRKKTGDSETEFFKKT